MLGLAAFAFFSIVADAAAQQAGSYVVETHPKLPWQTCTGRGSCTSTPGEITLDANWRWAHDVK